jgi:hypothetical protein
VFCKLKIRFLENGMFKLICFLSLSLIVFGCKRERLPCRYPNDTKLNIVSKIYKDCMLDSIDVGFNYLNDKRRMFSPNKLTINDSIEVYYSYDNQLLYSPPKGLDKTLLKKFIRNIKENNVVSIGSGSFFTKIQTFYADTSYEYFSKYDTLNIDRHDKHQSKEAYDRNCYCVGFILLKSKKFSAKFDSVFTKRGCVPLIEDSIYYYRDILTFPY